MGVTFTGTFHLPRPRTAATNPSPRDRAEAVITSSSTITSARRRAACLATLRLLLIATARLWAHVHCTPCVPDLITRPIPVACILGQLIAASGPCRLCRP
jgi:hypothetical protein